MESPISPRPSPQTPGSQADSAAPKRRAPIACRRCRRMRSKCIHDKNPPCKSCLECGAADECEFPSRGHSDQDRQFRHPRTRADRRSKGDAAVAAVVKRERESFSSFSSANPIHDQTSTSIIFRSPKWDDGNGWSLLPDFDIVKEGVKAFMFNCFQLSFVHRDNFMLQFEQRPESVSPFLLLTMLSISARFNKTLKARYGPGQMAVDFARDAEGLVRNELYEPTLERCQAFYLLSIAQLASGSTNKSYINLGIATRFAVLMQLHREETYSFVNSSSPFNERVEAESARRTLWLLYIQDSLHSGPHKPASFSKEDITALLPSDEDEFRHGRIPAVRAALEGTLPAIAKPHLVNVKPRSLFASLVQSHHIWGIIARRVICNDKVPDPADTNSEFAKVSRRLGEFEDSLPYEHQFGAKLLKVYRQDHEDLAFISCTCSIRLCNIVLRKIYLDEMIQTAPENPSDPRVNTYQRMAKELFGNVNCLFKQIEAQFEDDRPSEERCGSQMAAFSVYTCGILATYLCKFPHLRHLVGPDVFTVDCRRMYDRAVEILEESRMFWPMANSWIAGLRKWYNEPCPGKPSLQGGSLMDVDDPQPLAPLPPPTPMSTFNRRMSAFSPPNSSVFSYADRGPVPTAESRPMLAPLQPMRNGCNAEPQTLPPLSPFVLVQQQQLPQSHHHQNRHHHQEPEGANQTMLHDRRAASYPRPPPQQPQHRGGGGGRGFHAPYYHAGQHQAPPSSSIGDDGFAFHLRQFLDSDYYVPKTTAAPLYSPGHSDSSNDNSSSYSNSNSNTRPFYGFSPPHR